MVPRSEYPRPQFVREGWQCLNGEWEFYIDNGISGKERRLFEASSLPMKITVPFCPESELSGVNNKDFMPCVWYRKAVNISEDKLENRVLLHIDAADWRTEVWINGKSAGTHIGGYIGFSFDITALLQSGENVITICCEDELRKGRQPFGKQSDRYFSYDCSYTRTTGIWQSVWLEFVPKAYVASTKYTPDIDNNVCYVEAECIGANGMMLNLSASYKGKVMGSACAVVHGTRAYAAIKLDELHLWGAGTPELYELTITLGEDKVESYFGMRSIVYTDGKFLLNGKPVFQRLILDQGFYPDGIYTAPTDSELENDILRSMAMGFNGARLHQKIFEPRFLYYCDIHGYLVWGEHASWGLNISVDSAYEGFIPEWTEALKRDYNHPAIVGWCPLNETNDRQNRTFVKAVYELTKHLDSTRPVIDTSGYIHVVTDVVDCHDYDQDPETFRARYINGNESTFVSEYGGIGWNSTAYENGWGYGNNPKTEEEFIARYKGLTDALLDSPYICALCYTQLTDVEQEINGLYTYDRKPKFDPAIIHAITSRKAAIEE